MGRAGRQLTFSEAQEFLNLKHEDITATLLRSWFAANKNQDEPKYQTYDKIVLPKNHPHCFNETEIVTTLGRFLFNFFALPDVYLKKHGYVNETIEEFALKIKESSEFAKKWGNLGPVYGKQWRNFGGVDQLEDLINQIKTNPTSRRLIISAWNPAEIKDMALPPCHCFMQFYVNNNKLSCQLYQRSADVFLGVPFNIASYALFTMMIAQVCNLELGDFVHTIGDAHIYLNHLEQINKQLTRTPRQLPTMKINPEIKSIYDFKFDDFELVGYDPYKGIKGKVAV